ncbi:hypothetical protein DENSPDRAFT_887172, partial [Dentipellis sp. KUC8613]
MAILRLRAAVWRTQAHACVSRAPVALTCRRTAAISLHRTHTPLFPHVACSHRPSTAVSRIQACSHMHAFVLRRLLPHSRSRPARFALSPPHVPPATTQQSRRAIPARLPDALFAYRCAVCALDAPLSRGASRDAARPSNGGTDGPPYPRRSVPCLRCAPALLLRPVRLSTGAGRAFHARARPFCARTPQLRVPVPQMPSLAPPPPYPALKLSPPAPSLRPMRLSNGASCSTGLSPPARTLATAQAARPLVAPPAVSPPARLLVVPCTLATAQAALSLSSSHPPLPAISCPGGPTARAARPLAAPPAVLLLARLVVAPRVLATAQEARRPTRLRQSI